MNAELLGDALRRGSICVTGGKLRTSDGYRVFLFNPCRLCGDFPDLEELGIVLNLISIISSYDDDVGMRGFKNIIDLRGMTL